MKVDGRPYRTIWLNEDGASVDVIDQRWLPHEFKVATLRSVDEAATAIRDMWVRGAPLIGATAAYGLALAMREDPSDAALDAAHEKLAATRPTAINLRWALDAGRKHLAPARPARARRRGLRGGQARRRRGRRDQPRDWRARPQDPSPSGGGQEARRTGQHPHPLQRRLAGDGRLRHRHRADLSGDGGGRERPCLCRRDAPAQSGRLADRLGARPSRRAATRSSSTTPAAISCSTA